MLGCVWPFQSKLWNSVESAGWRYPATGGSDFNNVLAPFQKICTPMQTSKKA